LTAPTSTLVSAISRTRSVTTLKLLATPRSKLEQVCLPGVDPEVEVPNRASAKRILFNDELLDASCGREWYDFYIYGTLGARNAGFASITIWIAVAACGRSIAYF
jgi:hypothetical protein